VYCLVRYLHLFNSSDVYVVNNIVDDVNNVLMSLMCRLLRNCYMFGRMQGDHLSVKPGNVREFDSCQGFY